MILHKFPVMYAEKWRWQQLTTNEEMKTEFAYFGEVWTLFKKYYEVQQESVFWDALLEDASEINQRYHCELCKDLLMAVMNELERKRVRQKSDTDA